MNSASDEPLIEKLRQALIHLDFIDDVLKETVDATDEGTPGGYLLKNLDRIRVFIYKELSRRERALLERLRRNEET